MQSLGLAEQGVELERDAHGLALRAGVGAGDGGLGHGRGVDQPLAERLGARRDIDPALRHVSVSMLSLTHTRSVRGHSRAGCRGGRRGRGVLVRRRPGTWTGSPAVFRLLDAAASSLPCWGRIWPERDLLCPSPLLHLASYRGRVPLNVVAENCGTSVRMIETTYAKVLASKRREFIARGAPSLFADPSQVSTPTS